MKLKCQQCGTEKEFANHKDAFKEGWDFPPLCSVITCGECPSAPLVVKNLDTLKGIDYGRGLVDVGGHIPPYIVYIVKNPNPPSNYKKS